MEILGHIIGFIAIGLYFTSYQIFDKKKLLLVQTLATATMCIQYILIGANSGFALNIVCIIRNICFYNRDKKYLSSKYIPIALALIMAATSLMSWDGYYSLFIIAGLMLNTVCMGFCNSQNLRKSILVSCPLIIIYNVFSGSVSGIISESLSIISAVIGIIRYVRAQNVQGKNT